MSFSLPQNQSLRPSLQPSCAPSYQLCPRLSTPSSADRVSLSSFPLTRLQFPPDPSDLNQLFNSLLSRPVHHWSLRTQWHFLASRARHSPHYFPFRFHQSLTIRHYGYQINRHLLRLHRPEYSLSRHIQILRLTLLSRRHPFPPLTPPSESKIRLQLLWFPLP